MSEHYLLSTNIIFQILITQIYSQSCFLSHPNPKFKRFAVLSRNQLFSTDKRTPSVEFTS